jgi:hypothetical protein
MSKSSKTKTSLTGDFLSEDAVRGAFGRRRGTPPRTETGAVAAAGRQEPSSRHERRPLRRWSVAKLIAKAATPSVTGGPRH